MRPRMAALQTHRSTKSTSATRRPALYARKVFPGTTMPAVATMPAAMSVTGEGRHRQELRRRHGGNERDFPEHFVSSNF
jgi:hypothetical protein